MSMRSTTALVGLLFGCGSSGGGASTDTDSGTGSTGSGDPTSASTTAPTTTANKTTHYEMLYDDIAGKYDVLSVAANF